ncbi:MAG: septum formation initiator family protein [Candidatus Andersenbacteria bacterium]
MQPKPKLIIGSTAIVVVLILMSLGQEVNRRWQVQREVAQLDQEVQALQKNVLELNHLNQYFRTDDYQERLAREKLNYRAPDEHVVLIPDESAAQESKATLPKESKEQVANPMRWWRIFFVDGPAATGNQTT